MRQIFESAIVPAAGKRIEIQGGEMARLKWKIARIASVALLATVALGGCDKEAQMKEQDFVGKWHSSKANAPIRLDANGEWELLTKLGDGERDLSLEERLRWRECLHRRHRQGCGHHRRREQRVRDRRPAT